MVVRLASRILQVNPKNWAKYSLNDIYIQGSWLYVPLSSIARKSFILIIIILILV